MNSPVCKYHPTEYASWYCPNCKVHSCINCVTDPRGDLFPSCTLCRKTLTSLSLAPIQPNISLGKLLNPILQVRSLLFIFVCSLFIAFISNSDVPNWLSAILTAIIFIPIIVINFSIMEKVANNEPFKMSFKTVATSDNRDLLVKFMTYLVLVTTLIIKLVSTSNLFAQLLAAWLILAIPSSLVIIMMEKRFFSAFNPLKMFLILKIFSSIYLVIFIGWLCIFSLLAMPSVLMSQSGGENFMQSLLANCLAIFLIQFVFRLMGAAIFKNHVELNYSVRSTRRSALKNAKQDSMIEVDIYVQEGRFEDAIKILWKMVDQNGSPSAYEKLISIYHFQNHQSYCQKVAQQYFERLEQLTNYKRAAEFYCQMRSKGIALRPESDKLALGMANEMKNPQQVKDAIALLEKSNYQPSSNADWESISLCLAQLEFEFNQNINRALDLVNTILKRSVDQVVLEKASNYKRVIESN